MSINNILTHTLLAAAVLAAGEEDGVVTGAEGADVDVGTVDFDSIAENVTDKEVVVVEAPSASKCFNTSARVNDRGDQLPVVSDIEALSKLTTNHRITKFRMCYTDSKIVGM